MKRISVSIIILLLTLFFSAGIVKASDIVSAEYKNEQITIKGTGNGQVQIVLFNSSNAPMYMTTTDCENGEFQITLPKINGLTVGNYKIKVADYNGKNVKEKSIEITEKDKEEDKIVESKKDKTEKSISNPHTGDKIILYVVVLCGSIVGIIATVIANRKRNKIYKY